MKAEKIKPESLRVLLVDDEYSIREPLAKNLKNEHGYQIDTAANVCQTLECVREATQPYDVALIDDILVYEPDLSPEPIGIELMTQIKQHSPETECIIFTGWGMERALDALQAGAYRYLAKPANPDELGVTIQLAAEQSRLRRERDLLSTALEISNAMISQRDVSQTLSLIAASVPKLVKAEACTVARLDNKGKVRYEPMALTGDVTIQWQQHISGVALTKRIIQTGQPYVVDEVATHPEPVDEKLCQAGIKSFIGMPVPGQARPQGVLYAYSTHANVFHPYAQQMLQLLAEQVAIALEKTRLFEVEVKRRQEAETLREAVFALTTTLDQQEILERILKELQKVVPYDSASVQLLENNHLVIIAGQGFPNLSEILGNSFSLDGDNPNQAVMRDKKCVIIPDASAQYANFLKEPHIQAGVRGWLGAPMLIKDRLIGMIALDKRQSDFYTEEHARLAHAFATQAAIALENTRLYKEIGEHVKEMELLYALGVALNSSLKLQEVLERISVSSQKLIEAEISNAVVYDKKSGDYVYHRESRLDKLEDYIPRSDGYTMQVMTTGQKVHISDMRQDERGKQALLEMGIRSMVGLPIRLDNQVIGVLFVYSTIPNRFDAHKISLLSFLTNQAAIAIANARSVEQIKTGLKQFQALYEAGSAIISTMNPDGVLEDVAEKARLALGGWRVKIALIDDNGKPTNLIMIGFTDDSQDNNSDLIRSNGISMQVKQSGRSWWAEDIRQRTDEVNPVLLQDGVRAAACMPFGTPEREMGVMWIHYRHSYHFSKIELEAMRLYATQAAIAYENARQLHELDRLRQTAEKLVGVTHFQDVLRQIVESAHQLCESDSAILWLYDNTRHTLLSDQVVAQDINEDLLDQFRDIEPDPHGTTHQILQDGYLCLTSMPDCPHLEPSQTGLRRLLQVAAFQGVALPISEELIGILYVNYKQTRHFRREDKAALKTFAHYATLTLRKARLLEHLSKVRDTAKIIAEMSLLEDLPSTLNSIVKGLRDVLECDVVVLYPYDHHQGQFDSPAMIGANYPEQIRKATPDSIPYRIIEMDSIQIIKAPATDSGSGFIQRENIQSSAGIPLIVGENKVGALFVNYRSDHRFTQEEETNISLFAHQAAVAIRNARLYEERKQAYEELKRAKDAASAHIQIAWFGMASSAWRHSIQGNAVTIHDLTIRCQKELPDIDAYPQLAKLQERIALIQRKANEIIQKKMTPPLSSEGGAEVISLNGLVGERTRQLEQNEHYKEVVSGGFHLALNLPDTETVWGSREWLRHAFDILVDNAVNAVAEQDVRQITIGTQRGDRRGAEIFVTDTGPGIPAEIRTQLGWEVIQKNQEKFQPGMGVGLIMAQTIVRAYGGQIRIGSTDATGTTMIIWLPSAKTAIGE